MSEIQSHWTFPPPHHSAQQGWDTPPIQADVSHSGQICISLHIVPSPTGHFPPPPHHCVPQSSSLRGMALPALIKVFHEVAVGIYTAAMYNLLMICSLVARSLTPFNSFCALARSVVLWAWKTLSISSTTAASAITSFTFCWVVFKVSLAKLSSLSWFSGCNLTLRSKRSNPRIPAQLLVTAPHQLVQQSIVPEGHDHNEEGVIHLVGSAGQSFWVVPGQQ